MKEYHLGRSIPQFRQKPSGFCQPVTFPGESHNLCVVTKEDHRDRPKNPSLPDIVGCARAARGRPATTAKSNNGAAETCDHAATESGGRRFSGRGKDYDQPRTG